MYCTCCLDLKSFLWPNIRFFMCLIHCFTIAKTSTQKCNITYILPREYWYRTVKHLFLKILPWFHSVLRYWKHRIFITRQTSTRRSELSQVNTVSIGYYTLFSVSRPVSFPDTSEGRGLIRTRGEWYRAWYWKKVCNNLFIIWLN